MILEILFKNRNEKRGKYRRSLSLQIVHYCVKHNLHVVSNKSVCYKSLIS